MDTLISVIVPIYNIEPYVLQCVESILLQTYKRLEIILVDDGSTDGCPALCDALAKRDSRIKVIHKTNGGLVSARKAGLSASTGDYIGYVDGDDWIDPAFYETLYQAAEAHQADIVASGRIEEYPSGPVIAKNFLPAGVYTGESLHAEFYPYMLYSGRFFQFGVFPTVWDKLFKRELLLNNQMLVDNMLRTGEDAACTYPCFLDAETVCLVNECLYHYRKREDSMLRTKDPYYFERVRVLYTRLKNCFEASLYAEVLLAQLDYYIMNQMLDGARQEFELKSNPFGFTYLFPFSLVEKGSRVILYGAGNVGQVFYRQIKATGYCNLTIWVDHKYEKYGRIGLPVSNPTEIAAANYDFIVIAVSESALAQSIKSYLLSIGADEDKIIWSDKEF